MRTSPRNYKAPKLEDCIHSLHCAGFKISNKGKWLVEREHTAHSTLDDWEPRRGPRQPRPHTRTGPEGGAS
jgi:hypothetical protein